MTRFLLVFASACIFQFTCVHDAQAQYYGAPYYGGHAHSGYGGYSNYSNSSMGYCLKNDCYGHRQGGFYGGGGHYGGGFYGGSGHYGGGHGCYGYGGCGYQGHYGGAPAVIVRVRVNGQNAAPQIQTYYPNLHHRWGGYGQKANAPAPQASKAKATAPARTASNAGYRYKF